MSDARWGLALPVAILNNMIMDDLALLLITSQQLKNTCQKFDPRQWEGASHEVCDARERWIISALPTSHPHAMQRTIDRCIMCITNPCLYCVFQSFEHESERKKRKYHTQAQQAALGRG